MRFWLYNRKMEYLVKKSSIPVLWLDTFAITQISAAVFQRKQGQDYNKNLFEQYVRLTQLRAANRIIIFESDQLLEIAVRQEMVKLSGQVLSLLTRGLIVYSYEVKRKQLMQALDAFAKDSANGMICWNDIYSDDPLGDRSVFGVLVRCNAGIDTKLNQKKQMDEAIYNNWLKIRRQYVGGTTKNNFPKQLDLERRGGATLAQDIISRLRNGDLTEGHPLYYEIIRKPGLYLKSRMSNVVDFESTVVDFYKSSHFTDLPMNDISFTLFAEKLCGNEKIKKSDQADIDNISAFLPYVNYMVIDKSMADKVNKHKLDKKYGTTLIRLKELDKVIESAESSI